MALRRGGRFRAKHPKHPHAECPSVRFPPPHRFPISPSTPAFIPERSQVRTRHYPRMHSPLSIRMREVGKTKLGETHARSIFETDSAATDIADTIQARRYKIRECPPPRTSAPRIKRWCPRCTYHAHEEQRRDSDPPKDPGCRPRRRGD